ncbi:uncharacterized protein LOC113464424 [Ceratina calcarata]|uniref:peptidyl-tRNA hydrolase n=1 Tax=Ceratina calcarata TaxID=156304 RepID=A0AAJ7S1X9_9HYME|nr:uncharacterized protein LOC113464424 [Ceratina calcarata]
MKTPNRNLRQVNNKRRRLDITISRGHATTQYLFYAILNTDLRMNIGVAAENIANALLILYNQLDTDTVKYQYVDIWAKSGRRITILKGYDHKHLKYLENELQFMALGTHALRQIWGRNRAIVVLAVFGQKEDMDEIFEGLSYLR